MILSWQNSVRKSSGFIFRSSRLVIFIWNEAVNPEKTGKFISKKVKSFPILTRSFPNLGTITPILVICCISSIYICYLKFLFHSFASLMTANSYINTSNNKIQLLHVSYTFHTCQYPVYNMLVLTGKIFTDVVTKISE